MASTDLTRQRYRFFRRKESTEDSLAGLPRGESPVLVRLVVFFGILSIASGVWSCHQSVNPFVLEGGTVIYKLPGKLLLFSGAMLITTGFITILKASSLIRIAILSLLSTLNIVLLAETVAGATAFALSTVVSSGSLNETLLQDLKGEYSRNVRVTFALDKIHSMFRCCGIRSPEDWLESYWTRNESYNLSQYPASCCGGTAPCDNASEGLQKVGCGFETTRSLNHRLVWAYHCAFSIILLHLTSYIVLCFLERKA